MKVKKLQKKAKIISEKRHKKYYIDYRLIRYNNNAFTEIKYGFAKVEISYTYRQNSDGSAFDKREERVKFLSWIETYKKMIKTKKYDLPVKYDDLQINQKRAVRLQYMQKQGMLCQYCNFLLIEEPSHTIRLAKISWNKFPKGFRRHLIHLHHSHITGMTIGAVHMRCNAYLWQYKKE